MKFLHSIQDGFTDILYIWKNEYTKVFKDFGVLLFFFALPFAYPIVYSLIYNPEVVHDVPMVVVDDGRTPLSRELTRRMDASPNAQVIAVCANMDEAKHLMYEKKAFAVLHIPRDFSRKVGRGEQGSVSLFADMSLLLNYKGFLIALTDISLDMGAKIQSASLPGATQEQIDMATNPIPYSSITLYNPASGFASFLIPAILVLILQQSLILGIGMIAGGIYEHKQLHRYYSDRQHVGNNILHLVSGKSLCYFSLYIIPAMFLLHIVPTIFKFPQLGDATEINLFAVPLLLASIFFGMTLSVFVRERESSFLLFVFTSMIFLFVSGITWPRYAMPAIWRWLGVLVPSTWGIEGYVAMNTAGANLSEVRQPYIYLWIQTVVYFVTTCLVYRYQIYKDKQRGFKGSIEVGK